MKAPTAPRIPLLAPQAAAAAAEAAQVLPRMAELNVFRTLLHQPEVAKRIQDLLVTLLFRAKLDARLRELIILRLGWQTGSCYEWTQHWNVSVDLGLPEEDLLAVRDWRGSDRFDEADRAVLAATDEMLEDGAISAETFALCARHVGEASTLVELVATIGNWRMISSILRSLDVPLEEGTAPWPPDGATPQR